MKVMVVGGGGREHAIVKKLAESPEVTSIVAAPGNGGMTDLAECVGIGAGDIQGLVTYASNEDVDYVVVAPDGPLVDGAVDAFEAQGIPCFGPGWDAAQLEGSKSFAKEFMARHDIPTAAYAVFDDEEAALEYLDECTIPVVVKADGLALGKGVTVAATREEAKDAVREAMSGGRFGASGAKIVVEECLTGPEVSVLAFVDGTTIKPMVSAMDHKRIGEGDTGPNTGGMGTFAPSPLYTPELAEQCMREIYEPTVRGMSDEGRPFKGCLYFGLMLTPDGPKVIEYNCRFGDPETQVVLPLMETDLFEAMRATTEGRLDDVDVRFSDGAAACVVMSSEGYPDVPRIGDPITIPDDVRPDVYVAGAREEDGQLVTSGGRVLGVVGTAPTLREALTSAYEKVDKIHFDGAYHRRDIGAKVLEELA